MLKFVLAQDLPAVPELRLPGSKNGVVIGCHCVGPQRGFAVKLAAASPGEYFAGRAYVDESRRRMVQQVKHVIKVVADLAEQFAPSATGLDGIVAVNGDTVENDEVPSRPVCELKRIRPASGSEDRPVFPSEVLGGDLPESSAQRSESARERPKAEESIKSKKCLPVVSLTPLPKVRENARLPNAICP